MDLDRGTLARIDRKLLARLDQHETFQMVRVPATAAKWPTWKRSCDAVGISLGRAILALIDHQTMATLVSAARTMIRPSLVKPRKGSADREAQVAARDGSLMAAMERLRGRTELLRLLGGRPEKTALPGFLWVS